MWKDAANLMFFGIASLGLAYAAGKLVLLVGECRIRHHDGVRGMGATMACRARIEAGLQARRLERSRELATQADLPNRSTTVGAVAGPNTGGPW